MNCHVLMMNVSSFLSVRHAFLMTCHVILMTCHAFSSACHVLYDKRFDFYDERFVFYDERFDFFDERLTAGIRIRRFYLQRPAFRVVIYSLICEHLRFLRHLRSSGSQALGESHPA